MNVMVVGSLNTLLFNGHPLLRYDGYYVLSDLVEIPNLAEQSSTACATWPRVVLAERRSTLSEWTGWRRGFLLVYGVASQAYRFVLVAMLLWFCYRATVPYRLETLAALLAASVIGGMIAGPLWRGIQFARTPTVGHKFPRGRLFACMAIIALLAAAIALVPLPVRMTAPVVVTARDAQRVYVSEPGTLERAVRAGQAVQAGEMLARLANPDLDLKISRLTGQRNRQQSRLENLERRRGQDRAAAAEIPTAREALADLDQPLAKRHTDRERLILKAPIAGTVFAPEWNSRPTMRECRPARHAVIAAERGDVSGDRHAVLPDRRSAAYRGRGRRRSGGYRSHPGGRASRSQNRPGCRSDYRGHRHRDRGSRRRSCPTTVGQNRRPRQPYGCRRNCGPLSASYQVRIALAADDHAILLGTAGVEHFIARPNRSSRE